MMASFSSSPARTLNAALFSILPLAAAVVLTLAAPAMARQLQAPGSRIQIDLPDGFKPADRFMGFQHPSGASIVLIEAPAFAYEKMKPGLTAAHLKTRGVLDVEPIDIGRTDKHLALKARQPTAVVMIQKLIMLVGDAKSTALLSANLPLRDGAKVSPLWDGIRKAFATATLADKAAPRDIGFAMRYTGPFKEARSFGFKGRTYNLTGELPRERVTKESPTFVIAPSFDRRVGTNDLKALARRMVEQVTAKYTGRSIAEPSEVTIDNLKGYRHRVTGKANGTGEDVVLIHIVLFEETGGYVRMIASTPAGEADKYEPEIDKMALSFHRTKK